MKITDNLYRITLPYKDIFTTVYLVKTEKGVLIFDSASYDDDVKGYILPLLDEAGVKKEDVKYIFISHHHPDHSGALGVLIKELPDACIVSRSPELTADFAAYNTLCPEDGIDILDVLKVVAIPGHTPDSAAILDTRTGTLITGDCMQLYGIFGSGLWAANIRLPRLHLEALAKVRKMDINSIYAAHDYHPCGYCASGKEEVAKFIDSCIEPLDIIKDLILSNPSANDEELAAMYNASGKLPTLGAHVVTAMREMLS